MNYPRSTDDHDAILRQVDDFVRSVVVPLEERNADLLSDPRNRFTTSGSYSDHVLALKREVRTKSAAAGLYTLFTPRELGGSGAGPKLHYRVWERLYHACGPDRVLPYDTIAHLAGGPSVALGGTGEELRRDVVPSLVRGDTVLCVGQTESRGSAPTTAVADSDGWVITGTKHWVSRAPFAELALVYAITDRGVDGGGRPHTTAFLIPTDSEGFRVEAVVPLFGRIGGEEATVVLDDVRASDAQVVGRVHGGAEVAGAVAPFAAMFTAGRFVGLARWVLERTLEGTDIEVPPPGCAVPLADTALEVYAAHVMAMDCARRLEAGDPASAQATMTRLYANEACARAYDRCMQVQGPGSLTNDAHVFDGWHQSRIVMHADPGSQATKWNVARRVIHGDVEFD